MLLLTGPAGSGKSTFVLDRFRDALPARDAGVRLVVPTTTVAQHLQNRIAREGFVFRRSLIQTFSEFVAPLAGEAAQAPETVLYLIVEQAVRRVGRAEFARVADMPGFCARLAHTVAEFSAAGCESTRLASCLPDAPLAEAFLAVYREVDREIARRGLATRAQRLARAAEKIRDGGLAGVHTVWMDGFYALPDPELGVVAAVGERADLTLTSEAMDARLAGIGFEERRLAKVRATPVTALFQAASIEREVEEITRRILEHAAGRPFREIGIIVRSQETYAAILRSTLERFGIPARFYFDWPLDRHPAVRFLSGAMDAMLGGWDHAQTLAVLRLAPRAAASNTMDEFAFAVAEQIPNQGLESLRALGHPRVCPAEFAGLEELRELSMRPAEWAARLRTLRNLYRPDVELYTDGAAALDGFDEALDEAAMAIDADRAVRLEAFWPAVLSVLRLKPLRPRDQRRNVVHVLSAHEARQWVLPVVFVCGMVEKEFPQPHRQDPFFPDESRRSLNRAGIRVRTVEEFERDERALYESAVSRATVLVTLSYPEFSARSERNLPSLYLDGLPKAQAARAVRPVARGARPEKTPVAIRAPHLLDRLRERTARLSPSALESFLQCPFQHFGTRVLRLKTAPRRPEDRLRRNYLLQGEIVHEVLKIWWKEPQDLEALFERVFLEYCQRERIQRGYHTERLRNRMLDDLRGFAADVRWPRALFESQTEETFTLAIDAGLEISGRIDRIDKGADGRAYIIDYKYSAAENVRKKKDDETLLQAPLYMLAAERQFGARPAGMFYVGLKKGVTYVGWSEGPVGDVDYLDLAADWREDVRERTLRNAAAIRSGRIEAAPADRAKCRYCDVRDVCRVGAAGDMLELAEGGE